MLLEIECNFLLIMLLAESMTLSRRKSSIPVFDVCCCLPFDTIFFFLFYSCCLLFVFVFVAVNVWLFVRSTSADLLFSIQSLRFCCTSLVDVW